jgi:hypothetical protein
MRKLALITPVVTSAALVLFAAAPASAQDTTTTFQVTGGALGISVPASASLGPAEASPLGLTVDGQLGAVTVTDGRGGVSGWTATVASTDFASGGSGDVPATAVSYTPPTAPVTGTASVAATPATGLSTAKPVQTATAVAGANTAAWNPAISVAVPAGARAATYTATITHSVA